MANIKVTIIDPLGDHIFEVSLPDDAPMSQLVPQLLPKLGINKQGSFTLQHQESGSILTLTDTLDGRHIKEGANLRIVQAPTAAGGIPIRTFRDIQLVEAVLNNGSAISASDKRVWFAVILYTNEDRALQSYIRSHFRELQEMSAPDSLFFVIEEPSPEWMPHIKKYLGDLSGKYFEALWERLGTETFQPFDTAKAYEIARHFNVSPQQLPCIIFFTELKAQKSLTVEIKQFVPNSEDDIAAYTNFFRALFSCTQVVRVNDEKSLVLLAKAISLERRKYKLKAIGDIEPTKLTTSLIEILGSLIKAFLP